MGEGSRTNVRWVVVAPTVLASRSDDQWGVPVGGGLPIKACARLPPSWAATIPVKFSVPVRFFSRFYDLSVASSVISVPASTFEMGQPDLAASACS